MVVSASFLEPLSAVPGVVAQWVGRIQNIPVDVRRDAAMCRLRAVHRSIVRETYQRELWWRAEQVHKNRVAVVPQRNLWMGSDGLPMVPGVDGLITNKPGEILGIYVADCAPIWLADRGTGAVALLHSGKKGTEQNILKRAVKTMQRAFGTQPQELVAVLGPCIRYPDYEVDFAGMIAQQAEDLDIADFHDSGENTASDLQAYYSYRKEKGKTGRMLALIARQEPA